MQHFLISSIPDGHEYTYEGSVDKDGNITVLASWIVLPSLEAPLESCSAYLSVREDVTPDELTSHGCPFSREHFNKVKDAIDEVVHKLYEMGFKRTVFDAEAIFDVSKDAAYLLEVNPRAACGTLLTDFTGVG